mgnify:FL=1
MNKQIKIEVTGSINRFINKCIYSKIYLSNISYIDNDKITCIINLDDYKKVKRLNYYSKIKIISYVGFNKFKEIVKNNIFYVIIFILAFILIDILTSYIVDIEVIHSSSSIRKLIYQELENNNVRKNTFAYSFEELENIQKNILNNNKDKLEWISITKDGMKYIIRCEERKIKEINKENGYRNIVAKKDAYITKIISTKGVNLVRSGEYVKKGDVLISGEIKLYEEVKGDTLATGYVYGNVWYNVQLSIPKEENKKEYTGKSRFNININDKIFLRNKYKYFSQENIREIKILGLKIKFYKEKEYVYKKHILSDEEIEKIINDKIKEKFNNIGTINSQKVLKKEINNSTIDYRVFVICNELINEYQYYEKGDASDTRISN